MQIKNTQQYDNVPNIVALVYGVGGVGKTTFAATFPKPLLLDFENGAKYFKQRGINIDVARFDARLTNTDKKELAAAMKNYETIIFDPVGEMMNKLIDSDAISGSKYRQSNGDLTMAGWGKVKEQARNVLKWARDLGKHVVIVAHVDEKADEETLVKRPLIATRLGDEIIAMVDIVGYLDIINVDGTEKRVLRVNPADKKYIAKDRTGALDAYVKPDFEYIYNQIKSKQSQVVVEPEKEEAKEEAPAEEETKAEKQIEDTKKKYAPKKGAEDDLSEANPFKK